MLERNICIIYLYFEIENSKIKNLTEFAFKVNITNFDHVRNA